MAASSVIGEIVEMIVSFDLSESSNKLSEPLLDGPAKSEHMSTLLPFKFPASGKYDAILNSFVTTTTTMHVQARKALFYVIMHKVYSMAILRLNCGCLQYIIINSTRRSTSARVMKQDG